jgi:L-fucose mutarotase/ribose pyranase (RbsD/FucU family)
MPYHVLKGNSPPLLAVLAEMGGGDEICNGDGNFTANDVISD